MGRFDPSRAVTSQQYLWDLARALHQGHSWGDIAKVLGYLPRAYQSFYRPRVRSYVLRLLDDSSSHGTIARYTKADCYPDGRRCEPCTAANAEHLRRNRNRRPVRTDPAFLAGLARRLVDGDSWEAIAVGLDRPRVWVQDQVRELVQPYVLALVDVEQPSTTHRAHGSHAKYVVDRCRCEACRYANRVYERGRQRKTRRGLVPYVDAGPVRDRLVELAVDGVGLKQVAIVSGVPHGALSKIVYGDRARGQDPSKGVRATTACKIMAVKPTLDVLAGGARIDASPTRDRISQLLDMGASKTWIASQLTGKPTVALQVGRGATVTAATARKVRDLHAAVMAGEIIPETRGHRWAGPQRVRRPSMLPTVGRMPDGWRAQQQEVA